MHALDVEKYPDCEVVRVKRRLSNRIDEASPHRRDLYVLIYSRDVNVSLSVHPIALDIEGCNSLFSVQ